MSKIGQATKVITDRLRKDDDFRESLKATIAMAFKDEYARSDKKYKSKQDIHKIANKAAEDFIDLWCA